MRKALAIAIMCVMLMSGVALASETNGANWNGIVPPAPADTLFGHGHGYDRCDERDWFVMGGEIDATLYEGAEILGIAMDFGTEVSYDSAKELRVMGKISPNLSPIIKPWVDKLFGKK